MGVMAKPKKRPATSNPWPARLLKLRELWGRDGKRLSQEKAAAKLGLSRRSWAGWEIGEFIPPQHITMLIDFLLEKHAAK